MAVYLISAALFLVAASSNISTAQPTVTEEERAAWPRSVDEAANRILVGMPDADKRKVRVTKRSDLILYHHGWGTGIRNQFGLWKGNKDLMADCKAGHPDDCSMIIIEKVWERLQKQ